MLKKLRLEAGLTQRQLAKLVGISQAHIAKIENEKVDPRLSTVNKILEVLTSGEKRKCKEIMTENVIFASPNDRVLEVSKIMMKHAISQLPVIENGIVIGTVTEESIIRNLSSTVAERKVEEIMEPPLPMIPENASINVAKSLLEESPAVLVVKKGKVKGIITRSDLLKIVSKTI
ncbi:XRE family transcriptional regulator [Candidatus Bathyarchaeota archaeon]|nr:MAG: XRE family transcriptional regulator [Candidatus Bathyarchaeota archaeon]